MSNWDGQRDAVRKTGKLQTMYSTDLLIPMVAPLDLGEIAAQRLVSTPNDTGIRYVEGPRRYSSADVAKAFSQALGAPVGVEVIPRDVLKEALQGLGFSEVLRTPARA